MIELIQNKTFFETSLSIFYQRIQNIRRKVFDLEEALKEKYKIPAIQTPIPDDVEPQIPRIVFNSNLGHSQLNFSQVNASLNVRYDNEFSKNYDMCEQYCKERLELIYPIIEKESGGKICYAGLINKIQYLQTKGASEEFLPLLAQKLLAHSNIKKPLQEFNLKVTVKRNNSNFINFSILNVRNFTVVNPSPTAIYRFPNTDCESSGIQIILDVNDKLAFNENSSYYSSLDKVKELFVISKEIINTKIDDIIKSGKIEL